MPEKAPVKTIERAMEANPEAAYLLARERYRARYKLSSLEMDAEPFDEFVANMEIRKLDGVRQKLDNERMNQRGGN